MIRNLFVRKFIKKGYAEFVNAAEHTCDQEILGKIRVVKKFGRLLPSHIKMIRSKCINDPMLAGQCKHDPMLAGHCKVVSMDLC